MQEEGEKPLAQFIYVRPTTGLVPTVKVQVADKSSCLFDILTTVSPLTAVQISCARLGSWPTRSDTHGCRKAAAAGGSKGCNTTEHPGWLNVI